MLEVVAGGLGGTGLNPGDTVLVGVGALGPGVVVVGLGETGLNPDEAAGLGDTAGVLVAGVGEALGDALGEALGEALVEALGETPLGDPRVFVT